MRIRPIRINLAYAVMSFARYPSNKRRCIILLGLASHPHRAGVEVFDRTDYNKNRKIAAEGPSRHRRRRRRRRATIARRKKERDGRGEGGEEEEEEGTMTALRFPITQIYIFNFRPSRRLEFRPFAAGLINSVFSLLISLVVSALSLPSPFRRSVLPPELSSPFALPPST